MGFGVAFCIGFEFCADIGVDVAFGAGAEYTIGFGFHVVAFDFNVGFECESILGLMLVFVQILSLIVIWVFTSILVLV